MIENVAFHTHFGWFHGVETNEIVWKWWNSQNRLRKKTEKVFSIQQMTENTKKMLFWGQNRLLLYQNEAQDLRNSILTTKTLQRPQKRSKIQKN